MKFERYKLLGIAVFFFVAGTTFGLLLRAPDWWEAVLSALITMLATFLGAKYAFSLTEKSNRKREDEDKVSAANRVIFNLIRIRNNFATVRRQIINPYKSNSFREFYIQPTSSLGKFESHSILEVQPFFHSSEPLLLNELTNLEMEIVTTLEWMEHRNQTHIDLQRRLEKESIESGEELTLKTIRKVVGSGLVVQLKSLTDQWIQGVDNVIEECDQLIPRLNKVLHMNFPSQKVFSMIPPAQGK
jgi:hypothetical protein